MPRKRQEPRFGPSGTKLWIAVNSEFQLSAHKAELLVQMAHCADKMAELQRQIDTDGLLVRKSFEAPLTANPLVAELRAQQNTYQRLLAALGLPTGVLGEQARPVTRNRKTKFEVEKLRPVPREGSVS